MSRSRIEIFFSDLMQSCDALEAFERDCPRLSPADEARAVARAQAGFADEARWWRAARIALRLALERAAGDCVRQVSFDVARGGRPELPAGMPQFSVSHSGSGVLIAVARDQPVGVDVERPRVLKMSAERRGRLLAADARLSSTSGACVDVEGAGDVSDAAVLRAWVRLEALAKLGGAGIGRLLTREGVVGGAGSQGGGEEPSAARVRELALPGGFVGAVAACELPDGLQAGALPQTAAELPRFLAGTG